METKHLKLQGMSCAGCASAIERVIKNVQGVTQGNVNFAMSQATITYDKTITNLSIIQEAIIKAGYQAFPVTDNQDDLDIEKKSREKEEKELTKKVIVGGIISSLLVIGSFPAMTGLHISWFPMWLHNSWVQLILSLPVQLWCGKTFFVGAFKAFKRHTADMNTLVSLGTGSAYLYSLFATFNPAFFLDHNLKPDVYY